MLLMFDVRVHHKGLGGAMLGVHGLGSDFFFNESTPLGLSAL